MEDNKYMVATANVEFYEREVNGELKQFVSIGFNKQTRLEYEFNTTEELGKILAKHMVGEYEYLYGAIHYAYN